MTISVIVIHPSCPSHAVTETALGAKGCHSFVIIVLFMELFFIRRLTRYGPNRPAADIGGVVFFISGKSVISVIIDSCDISDSVIPVITDSVMSVITDQ